MLKSNILDQIGTRHDTDKCSTAAAAHDYLRKYEFFFKDLRHEEFTLLELGVFKGASLKTWEEYFEKAEIIGVDCEAASGAYVSGRSKIVYGDLSHTGFLESLPSLNPRVIIDDASHVWNHQLLALFVLFPALMSGGIYIIEDIHTSFHPLAPMFNGGQQYSTFEILLKIGEYMTGNQKPAPIFPDKTLEPLSVHPLFDEEIRYIADYTDAITFIERACILIKK
ncbi:hypothetical protein C4J81_13455 [Deltaproteobacteria bacterium Smac51]|nr:hypothetical protein C4J81_13455 [Deltaproteobacteria bacterium Smac51]